MYWLSEFVDKDGKRIGGNDYKVNLGVYTPGDLTTDDFVKSTRQGSNRFLYTRRFWGEEDQTKKDVKVAPKKKTKKKLSKIEEDSKRRMEKMLEDILSNKSKDSDFVKKYTSQADIYQNGEIPVIDSLSSEHPILVKKVSFIKDLIERTSGDGYVKGILLNHILGMDMSDLPSEYKNKLINKLK